MTTTTQHVTETTAIADFVARAHESHRADLTAYIAAFRAAFGQAMSVWEIEKAGRGYMEGQDVLDCVADANLSYECRKADRNV